MVLHIYNPSTWETKNQEFKASRAQWLTPVILASQEAEIRRIMD
jgi:hypothetical protein